MSNEYMGHCPHCRSEQTLIEFDIDIKESTEYSTNAIKHTVPITQCKNCKLIVEDSE